MHSKDHGTDDMKSEYDFTTGPVEQGKFVEFARRANAQRRRLSPEMAEKFPDDESLDLALQEYLRLKQQSA